MALSYQISPPSSKVPSIGLLSLSALGIVFGDIGTSPLYTLKAVLALTGEAPLPEVVLGSLSLIIWTLFLVTTIKYVGLAMRINNDGEGGILALLSLLGGRIKQPHIIVTIGLLGAALIYGDGTITPAISVLSALEGLEMITPSLAPYILPAAVLVLLGLFAFQPHGTARIGQAFGPIMAIWFCTIALMGVYGIVQHPTVLFALNPIYGVRYLFTHGASGFLVLGSVFLCVTGAEALYADMGHFGARPIRLAWLWLVFPALLLNYAGQAALVLDGAPTSQNIFFRLCPPFLVLPLIILSTLATIIASQSIITGAFSMTRQASQLGWMPRLKVKQTSADGYGQIYVPAVNWCLMIVTLGLTIGFGKSDNLASAYGIAVSATMFATSILLFIAMREVWRWGVLKAGTAAGFFMIIDGAFFSANLSKVLEGGYVPLIFAALIFSAMAIWHKGTEAISARIKEATIPIDVFMRQLKDKETARVPGTAIFFTLSEHDTPPVMIWHVKQNRSLHRQLFILKVNTLEIPWVEDSQRLSVIEVAPDICRGVVNYGFMEPPDIPRLLERAPSKGCTVDLSDVTYYVPHETIIPRKEDKTLPQGVENIFAFMQRNSVSLGEHFHLPPDYVVEIGRQITV